MVEKKNDTRIKMEFQSDVGIQRSRYKLKKIDFFQELNLIETVQYLVHLS